MDEKEREIKEKLRAAGPADCYKLVKKLVVINLKKVKTGLKK